MSGTVREYNLHCGSFEPLTLDRQPRISHENTVKKMDVDIFHSPNVSAGHF